MSLVRELSNSNTLVWISRYSINTESWFSSCWQFPVDVDEFIAKIQNQANIAKFDELTKQNIFHFLLSTDIFPYSDTYSQQWHISKKDMRGLLHSVTDGSKPWKQFHANYSNFLQAGKFKRVSDAAEKNKKRIIEALLKFYANDDDALMRVLLSRDSKENTVLFVGYNSHLGKIKPIFDTLFDRINKLTVNQREELLIARNQEDKTILHAIADYRIDIPEACFDDASIRKALCITDCNHNTPLHSVLAHEDTKFSMLKSFCESAKRAQSEEKEFSLEKLFCQNLQGSNPLHLVCKRPKKSADDPQLLVELLKILPKKLAIDKIQEADQQDCTPLHYAIQSGQFEMIGILLDYLPRENTITSKNPKKSLLHHACQYGNSHIINRVIEKLSPIELYQIQEELPKIMKLVSHNSRVQKNELQSLLNNLQALDKPNKLFDLVKYLEHNFKDPTFTPKLTDFCNCWLEIETKTRSKQPILLPSIDPALSSGLHMGAFFKRTEPYYKLREELSKVTEQEAKEFRELIALQSRLVSENSQAISPLVAIVRQLNITQTQRLPDGSLPQYQYYEHPKIMDNIPYARQASPRKAWETNLPIAMPVDATQVMPPTAQPIAYKR